MAKVAAVQMVSGKDLDENLQQAAHWIEEAARQKAELVVLPETFSMFSTKRLRSLAEQEDREQVVQQFLADQSRLHNLWLVGGTTPMLRDRHGDTVAGERVRAASLVYNELGEQVARYDKIHLFDVSVEDAHGQYQESAVMEPGDQVVVVDTPVGKLGLSVCYDLRFPELYRLMWMKGAQIFSIPSAFTARTGQAHWAALLRARAIENLCYVVAADQGGWHTRTRETHGESMVVNPWGEVLNSIRKGPGIVVADVDPAFQEKLRKQLPVAEHRRFDISEEVK